MMSPMIRTLAASDLPALHAGFLEAFSDYAIPMTLELAAFHEMLSRRGIDWSQSLGLFARERIVGFWLHATDPGGGEAYVLSAGVSPTLRRQGWSTRLFEVARERALSRGIHQLRLEVLEDNHKAQALYRGLGFQIRRPLGCYRGHVLDGGPALPEGVSLAPVSGWAMASRAWRGLASVSPSWQNDWPSLGRAGSPMLAIQASTAAGPVAYGLVFPETGDLPQMAVAKDWRRRGVGSALLARLAAACSGRELRLVNVDGNLPDLDEWLVGRGLVRYTGQLEMVLALPASGQGSIS